jgi:hypothetical protein
MLFDENVKICSEPDETAGVIQMDNLEGKKLF